jgi:hypothetical protein
MNEIIELQYAKNKSDNFNNDWWLLEETIKLGKGNIKPSNYLENIVNNINNKNNIEIPAKEDEPIYIYK